MSMSKDETSARATRIAWIWIENEEGLYNAVMSRRTPKGRRLTPSRIMCGTF